MPFFGKRKPLNADLKKMPARKSSSISNVRKNTDPVLNPDEYGLNYQDAKLRLDGTAFRFYNGKWVVAENETSPLSKKRIERLLKEKMMLHEQNNFLRLKVEILLNLAAEMKGKQLSETVEMGDISTNIPNEQQESMSS